MRWIIGLSLFIALVAIAVWKSEALVLKVLDWRTPKTTLAEHQALLKDHITILTPSEGEAPFPTVIQFHGCARMGREFHENWANVALEAGHAAVIIDSNNARDIGYEEALNTICEGKALLGQERAGDVLAAIEFVKDDPRLNAEDIVLAGWSHGAWTLMDFFTMDMTRTHPANLLRDDLVKPDVDGAILFYPHCGPGALSKTRPWEHELPVLAFVAGQDSIVEPEPCINFFSAQEKSGSPTSLVVYPDADHIFDDATIVDDYPEYYDEKAAEDAIARYSLFLTTLRDEAK